MGGALAKYKPTFKYLIVTRTTGMNEKNVTIEGSVDDRNMIKVMLPPEMAPEILNPAPDEMIEKKDIPLCITTVLNCLQFNYGYKVVTSNATSNGEGYGRTEQWTLCKTEIVTK